MVVFMFTALLSFKRGACFSKVLLNWAFYCTFFLFSKHTGQPKGQNGVRLDEHGVRLEWEGWGKMKEGLGHWRNIAAICNVGLSFIHTPVHRFTSLGPVSAPSQPTFP